MEAPLLPWYIAGPLLGLFVPVFIILSGKQLGISSSFRLLVAAVAGKRIEYFNYNYRNDLWQAYLVIGLILASVVHFQFLNVSAALSPAPYSEVNPLLFLFGGALIGFGSRYANGCTAGHCIMGNAQFSLASFVATIGFFLGGLTVSQFLIPLIF